MKMKKWIFIMASSVLGILLIGCRKIEPEVRAYPLAIGIDYTGQTYRLFYAMPNMSAYAGDGKNTEKLKLTWMYEGIDFKDIEKQVRSSRQQLLDLGHVQILLFSEGLLNSGQPYENALVYLEEKTELGSGAYVFSCSNLEEIMKQNGETTDSLGEYLVDLVDKEEGVEQREKPKILQTLYNAWYNKEPVPKLLRVVFEQEYMKVLESAK